MDNQSSPTALMDTNMSDSILVDFEVEMEKERAKANAKEEEMKKELYAEITS
jgi:hypothetical protein